MCFSATVSFGAAAFIGSVGFAALKISSTTPQRAFALIPIFFALQQFSEGLIWSGLSNAESTLPIPLLTYFFLFFAWIVWPIYIPFSMRFLEQDPFRKKMITILLLIGTMVVLVLTYILTFHNVSPKVAHFHIVYEPDFTHHLSWILGIFYLLATTFACFVSSVKWMWYLGVINLASFLYSKLFFDGAVISIWCFFAAISSIFVFVIIKEMLKVPGEKAPVLT